MNMKTCGIITEYNPFHQGHIGSLTLAHSQNSQMSFMYGFFFVKFLFFTVVCVVIMI
jgi:predicted nucleotidyltransferase